MSKQVVELLTLLQSIEVITTADVGVIDEYLRYGMATAACFHLLAQRKISVDIQDFDFDALVVE